MKIRSVRIALALGLLCAIGAFFACTTTPENANRTATNQNRNVGQEGPNRTVVVEYKGECSEADLDKRRLAVENALRGALGASNRLLKVQLADNKNFRILFEGTVEVATLDLIRNTVTPFMQPGCVINVYLVRQGMITSNMANAVNTNTDPSVRLNEFRWGGCEGDLQACPDGSCAPTCPKSTPQMSPTPGTNGDKSLAVDANTKSNSNSNRAP